MTFAELGVQLLNNAISHMAETSETGEEFDSAVEVLETCRSLVAPTPLQMGLTATAHNLKDRVSRERVVARSLMEAWDVRRMA